MSAVLDARLPDLSLRRLALAGARAADTATRRPGPAARQAAATAWAHLRAHTRQRLDAFDRAISAWQATPHLPGQLPELRDPAPAWRPAGDPLPQPGDPAAARSTGWLMARSAQHDAPAASLSESLTAQLLDGFQLWLDGQLLETPADPKARALLQLLLLHRHQPLRRERLCRLLWPELPEAAARPRLHVAVHQLRRALGRLSLLRQSAEGYQLHVAGEVWLDVEHFVFNAEVGSAEEEAGQLATAIVHYETAAALYRADLLDGRDDEPALARESLALQRRHLEVLERIGALREALGDVQGSLRATMHLLVEAPTHEPSHQRLMRIYARLGQHALAEQQLRLCVTALRDRAGRDPAEATLVLARRIARREAV